MKAQTTQVTPSSTAPNPQYFTFVEDLFHELSTIQQSVKSPLATSYTMSSSILAQPPSWDTNVGVYIYFSLVSPTDSGSKVDGYDSYIGCSPFYIESGSGK